MIAPPQVAASLARGRAGDDAPQQMAARRCANNFLTRDLKEVKPFRYALSLSLLAVASVSGAKDHPAVEAAKQPSSYDYASKMYRHPAGLNLLAEAPRDLGQHPAILARKKALEAAAAPQLAYHPALLAESGRKLAVSPAINAGLLHPTSTGPSR